MSKLSMEETLNGLSKYYPKAEDAEVVVIECALTAAAATAIGSIVPGLALPATIISCYGAVWMMYARLCSLLEIKLEKRVLKLLARAALSNIAANLGGTVMVIGAGLFFPGTSVVTSAVISYSTIFLAGLVFLRLLLRMAVQSNDPSTLCDISDKELQEEMWAEKPDEADLNAARASHAAAQGAES